MDSARFEHQRANHSLAMFKAVRFRAGFRKTSLCSLIFSFALAAHPQQEKKTTTTTNVTETDALRGYLEVQEKLHATLLAIDRYQQEADDAAARAAETSAVRVAESLGARFNSIEQSLNAQRAHQEESWNKSNRLILILTSAFGGIGLLAFLGAAWLHWRAANRLAEVITISRLTALGPGRAVAELGSGDSTLPATISGKTNLLGTISRLEKRIRELEEVAHVVPPEENGAADSKSQSPDEPADSATDMRLKLLLGKGQSLLHLNKLQDAITCFDEALAIDPSNADAFVKKGSALERLEKLKEAIDCYDRAIQADDSLTIAYLQKGGVFNRLELYSMAQECYEQALRTQEKRPTA